MTADAAFDELFRAEWPRVVATVRRIVGGRGDPEALAAEAFTRAFARWPAVRRHPAPIGWILRVAINLAIDDCRRRPRAGQLVDLQRPSLAQEDDAAVLRVALSHALMALPSKQRQAIALRYLAGCDEITTAAALGISTGTVKTHLKRGLARLRVQIGSDLEGSLGTLS